MKIPETETVAGWRKCCLVRLCRYGGMTDDEDGKAPTFEAMKAAEWFISHGLALWPVPTMEGGIQLEGDQLEIEFGPEGKPDKVLLIGDTALSIYRSPPVCECGRELALRPDGRWALCGCWAKRDCKETTHEEG